MLNTKINLIAAKTLGTYIIQQRKKLRFSQTNVARRIKVSPQFLGHIEKGKVHCPETILLQLIDILKLQKVSLQKIYLKATQAFVESLFSKNVKK